MDSSQDKSHDVDSDACGEDKLKVKIKFGKDETGRITSGKIMSERKEEGRKKQSSPEEVSIENYQLSVNPDDAFHGFPENSVPDWVSDNFTEVDLKSRFKLKRICWISIGSKQHRQKHQAVPSAQTPVSVKTEPSDVEAPSLEMSEHTEILKLSMAVPRQEPPYLISMNKRHKKGPCGKRVGGAPDRGVVKEDPPAKCTRKRKARFENLSSYSSSIRISHMPKSKTFVALKEYYCSEPEAPPLFNTVSVARWVKDEKKKDSSPLPQSISPSQPPPSPPPSSVGNFSIIVIKNMIPAEVSSSLVSSSSSPHHQKVAEVSQQSKLVQREVSSVNSERDVGHNPAEKIGLGEECGVCPTSVIVANPAQAAKYQVSSYQLSNELIDNSCEVIDLTGASEGVDLVKEDKPDGEVIIVKELSLQLSERGGIIPAMGRTDNSNAGVEISLVIPANNNRNNTELKIKLNQSQVDELRNCLKDT